MYEKSLKLYSFFWKGGEIKSLPYRNLQVFLPGSPGKPVACTAVLYYSFLFFKTAKIYDIV